MLTATNTDEWSDTVKRFCYPLTPTRAAPGFRADVRHAQLERGIHVADIRVEPNELTRSARLVRQSPSNDVLLLVQLAGTAGVHSHERSVQLPAGSATLCDPITEYLVTAETSSRHLVLTMPRSVVGKLPVPVSEMRTRPISTDLAALRALVAVAEQPLSTGDDLAFHESDAFAGAILDLVRCTFLRATDDSVTSTPHETLAAAAMAHIRAHADDPRLTPDSVARAVGVSVRTLATAMRPIGSPAETIRVERLRRARECLADPFLARSSIAEIAATCGFTDATTFTRAFKREFGSLPSEYRRHR
ncbi:helix-turn-helix domain-containing protein [Streptomyces sp. NPDC026672]|uniref:helix-turn-helix domain-containing protein n=1 Tax=unclassified Streptomyces TaxID=2593676 RepID=UPI0033EC7F8C